MYTQTFLMNFYPSTKKKAFSRNLQWRWIYAWKIWIKLLRLFFFKYYIVSFFREKGGWVYFFKYSNLVLMFLTKLKLLSLSFSKFLGNIYCRIDRRLDLSRTILFFVLRLEQLHSEHQIVILWKDWASSHTSIFMWIF